MDEIRFASQTRTLTGRPSRRLVARILGTLTLLGIAPLPELSQASARHKKKHPKKPRPIRPVPYPVPPVPTCSDNLKNGTETDVDCGGPCGPCENGKTCSSLADCKSGLCSAGGICQTCSGDGAGNCPVDGTGQCQCSHQGACYSNSASIAPDCESCPEDTAACIFFDADLGANCYLRCGAV